MTVRSAIKLQTIVGFSRAAVESIQIVSVSFACLLLSTLILVNINETVNNYKLIVIMITIPVI